MTPEKPPSTPPKVSVLVPIYNVEHWLKRCLDHLVSQTLNELEIICVDDGSTDKSSAILAEYAAQDSRIIILTQENAGQAVARNAALSIARAPYIMFCDADDYYEPTICEQMLQAMESPEQPDMAICGVSIEYESNLEMKKGDDRYFRLPGKGRFAISPSLLARLDICLWNKIFRRDLLTEWDIRFPDGMRYEDVYFTSLYAMRATTLICLPDKLYHYTRRAESTMGITLAGAAEFNVDHLRTVSAIHSYLQQHLMLDQWKSHLGWLFFRQLDAALSHAKSTEKQKVIFDYADRFLQTTGLSFFDDRELAYNQYRLHHRRPIGSIRKKWGGLLLLKQKAQCVKYYICGICIFKSRAMHISS